MTLFRIALLVAALAFPGGALAATTAGQPFPTNLLTVPDASQATGLRVALPKPDCTTRPNDCADVDVLNSLDGFNIQPRISVPFSAPIDTATVSSDSIFLVGPGGDVVGINQTVWEPLTNTLHFESDEQLTQATTYLLVVTRDVRDANGERLAKATFRHDQNYGQTKDAAAKAYRKALLDALPMALAGGATPAQIATVSVFTTQSTTAISQKIRGQLRPTTSTFALGAAGERTVFPLSSVTAIQWRRQVGPAAWTTGILPTPLLSIYPGSIGTIAFGAYRSPDYETPGKWIPAYGTATGTPVPQQTNDIHFTLFVPTGAPPAGGWPTAIFGHGFTDSKNGAPWLVASSLAKAGLATIAINVVGHGGGEDGSYTVVRAGGPAVTLDDGGRSINQDGNGTIDSTEGVNAAPPNTLISNRDGLRQTAIDLMQLVRNLRAGLDVDGDGAADLSTSRIYYTGQSFGGIYGVPLLALEPDIRAGVPNVPGGPIIEIARLSPNFRILVGLSLLTRRPPLYNAVPDAGLTNFHENIPLRNLPLVTATPDETAIQTLIDRTEWAQQAANPAAYAPYLSRPLILQFARGDKTVPNPTTSAIIRAGNLQGRTTIYRHDLAYAANPALGSNPHTFLTNIVRSDGTPHPGAPFALAAQAQIATFLASDGSTVVDPDGAGPIFEHGLASVPEDLAYIP